MTPLKNPQTTLAVDDERPIPGGFENGLWNARPETPLTKCGMPLVRKTPAKNQAIEGSQRKSFIGKLYR